MTDKILRIYLDNCCYNRPYDDQSQIIVSLEAQAKIFIQNAIRQDKIELASSFVLRHENNNNPFDNKRKNISDFLEKNVSIFIAADRKDEVRNIAAEIISTGVKNFDAAHIACAILANCDYFLTTDKRVLKFRSDKIQIVNPVDFVKILEVAENVQHN